MPGQVFTDMDSGGPWAIADSTVNEDDVNPKLAPEAFLQPPPDNPRGFREAVNDYNQRKKERMPLTRRFNLSRSYVLLLPDDVAQFKASRTSPNSPSDQQSTYGQYLGITFSARFISIQRKPPRWSIFSIGVGTCARNPSGFIWKSRTAPGYDVPARLPHKHRSSGGRPCG
jgi:hypothetical protein